MEGEYIIGAVLDGQSVTIEPGGQFELSGAPVDTLHKTCSEVNSHLYQARQSWIPLSDAKTLPEYKFNPCHLCSLACYDVLSCIL